MYLGLEILMFVYRQLDSLALSSVHVSQCLTIGIYSACRIYKYIRYIGPVAQKWYPCMYTLLYHIHTKHLIGLSSDSACNLRWSPNHYESQLCQYGIGLMKPQMLSCVSTGGNI